MSDEEMATIWEMKSSRRSHMTIVSGPTVLGNMIGSHLLLLQALKF